MGDTRKISIACRLRPFLPSETADDGIEIVDDTTLSIVNPRDSAQRFRFSFQSCYGQDSTQEEIFDRDVQPLIDEVYAGITVTIFAYGVTSSGKTHTMQGTAVAPGIIPRVVESLFFKRDHLRRYEMGMSVSYMEIYKDDVYDLLVPRENGQKLPVRENEEGKVFVANLTEKQISSLEEFEQLYAVACKSRSVGTTNLNHASSRSHAILVLNVLVCDTKENKTLRGKINLVDLAGSENNKLTGNDASRMAESAAINKSLSVLGQVVHALNQGASRIPYRDSKLTRILQDALGGSSVGLLICNLAPGPKFRQDSLNTLNFATRTKEIENRPVANERENRSQPKAHFGAIRPSLAAPRPSVTTGRPSLVPVPIPVLPNNFKEPRSTSGPSRLSVPPTKALIRDRGRVSADAILDARKATEAEEQEKWKISQEDIEKKITKAVEEEVAKRLAEMSNAKTPARETTPPRPPSQPPLGSVTPYIQKHHALEAELRARLESLEKRLELGHNDMKVAAELTPNGRKKTAKAFLAVARASQDENKLETALQLYTRALVFAPGNAKLRARVEEVKFAIENGLEAKRTLLSFHSNCDEAETSTSLDERPGFKRRRGAGVSEKTKTSEALLETTNAHDDEERGGRKKKRREERVKAEKVDGNDLQSGDEEWVPRTPKKRRGRGLRGG